VIWRKIMEVMNMELTVREDTWPYIDEFFRKVPDAMQKVSTFQEALAESEQRGIQIGALQNQRRTLIHQVRRKFPDVPDGVIQQIEETEDSEQLDTWLDQILFAETLADIGLAPEMQVGSEIVEETEASEKDGADVIDY
jgi:hypothetical protein